MLALAKSMKVDKRIICSLSVPTLLKPGTCKAINRLRELAAPKSLELRTIRESMAKAPSLSPGIVVSVVEFPSKVG